ncbi:hypothetical protein PVAND_003097 [Polypedilum vanderplanki]|uniref:Peptidase S1 domain-containing protein n=1 Tax=Polypedilum vanderplanki TaxID=319348 RepID=A0A9J6BU37_POLVA|nr:hypothetical protein PVAND_003097 [Polypedilum vanderplanki]
MLLKLERSNRILFLVVLAVALSFLSVFIYVLWSISFDSEDEIPTIVDDGLMIKTRNANSTTDSIILKTISKETTTPSLRTTTEMNYESHRNYHLFNHKTCGLTESIVPRIFGGKVARFLSHPWMVVLYAKINSTYKFACGGTLISENLVLTAAHCIKPRKTAWEIRKIRLGEQNLETDLDCIKLNNGSDYCADPYQEITEFEFKNWTHQNYSTYFGIEYDIGLIKLKVKAKIHQNNINTICLPFPPTKEVNSNSKLEVIGFGKTENKNSSDQLLVAKVPFISIKECNTIYKTDQFMDTHICAGNGTDTDSCRGDSGGPLLELRKVINKLKVVQYGIVSAGMEDCGKRPGIYTNVQKYLDWILENADI